MKIVIRFLERNATTLFLLSVTLAMIILALMWGFAKQEFSMKFEEYGFITDYSSILLFTTGVVNFFLYMKQRQTIWLLIALGFCFLALDEKFLIHENLDLLIHQIFHLHPTKWTDRIDDFLILGYGIVGLMVLMKYRKTVFHNKQAVITIAIGFALMVVSVILDAVTNDEMLKINSIEPSIIHHLGVVAEESCKIISETFILSGFLYYSPHFKPRPL